MQHKYFYIIFAGLLATLSCNTLTAPFGTPAPIPTVVTTLEIPYATIEYYDVSGSTQWEIRDQLNTLASVDENGFRGDALTSWKIRWTWDGYGTEACDLSSVTATYDIEVRLPRWTPPQDASPELVTKWNTYVLALLEHEKVHVDNVVDYLPYLIKTIRGATCNTAEDRAQEVLAELRSADLKYDEETNHGATQGAIFP